MTRFIIGLLLGLLLGIGGTAAFLITAGGGDYLIVSSPRVRELEASLKNVDQDRQWLRTRLDEANESLAKLESRFSGLAARFESMAGAAASGDAAAPSPAALPTPGDSAAAGDESASGTPDPSTAPVEKPDAREPDASL
jgi:hypothetical protein